MGFNPVDLAFGNMDALRASNKRLKAENAELRELARTLWGWLLVPTVGPATLHDLQGQLKELGIEVEG